MNYTKNANDYGSEFWSFNVAGVSFRNEDGEDRQQIIRRLPRDGECNIQLVRYTYEGEPAYHVVMDGKTVGNVPRNIAAEFATKDDEDFWLVTTAAKIHGGDGGNYYGIDMTVKAISPAEREAKAIRVDASGNLCQGQPRQPKAGTMFCYKCGAEIFDEAVICPKCGCPTKNYDQVQQAVAAQQYQTRNDVSPKSRTVALLLAIFLGCLGVHRFYLGKIGTGIVWLLTGGCLGIGWLIDIILIACGSMRDGYGALVYYWNE